MASRPGQRNSSANSNLTNSHVHHTSRVHPICRKSPSSSNPSKVLISPSRSRSCNIMVCTRRTTSSCTIYINRRVMRRPNETFEMKRRIYLERIGLGAASKVFVMNSRDYHIREALVKKGWIELKDISDNFFHLKWVYADSSHDYPNLNCNLFISLL